MEQVSLFEGNKKWESEWWEEDWNGMPEFIQKDQTQYKEIVIKFRNIEDMKQFMKTINQEFTVKTKAIWFPKLQIKKVANLRYVDGK